MQGFGVWGKGMGSMSFYRVSTSFYTLQAELRRGWDSRILAPGSVSSSRLILL